MDEQTVIAALGIVNSATLALIGYVAHKIEKLSNGCFTRHMKIAEEQVKVEMKAEALHERLDRMEENYERM